MYESFLSSKLARRSSAGIEPTRDFDSMFPFQRDLVRWALRRGRSALFADTGLGKTRMQLEWARSVAESARCRVLILAPLAVADQTCDEGASIGVEVVHANDGSEVDDRSIWITNYERIRRFDLGMFGGVVLDESSIIKHHDAKSFRVLTDAFAGTPYRLCATATPSPNDYTELGTHAEFLGVCSRAEMLSEFFVHDGGDTSQWRLKGHARAEFWRFVASWGAMVRRPDDLGYDGAAYELPDLDREIVTVATDARGLASAGMLFAIEVSSLDERRAARKATLEARVRACAERVNADSAEPWVVWCDYNDESEMLARSIPGSVEIKGSDSIEAKEARLRGFARGEYRVLVSKPSICGWGLNWQHCARVAFVGVTDSFEAYYQAVRRCWRFGQTRPVRVVMFAADIEQSVVRNLERKRIDALAMQDELARETATIVRENVRGLERVTNEYNPTVKMEVPQWMF